MWWTVQDTVMATMALVVQLFMLAQCSLNCESTLSFCIRPLRPPPRVSSAPACALWVS